jgi:hypothetical protein
MSPGGQIGPFTCLALAYFSGCFFNSDGTQLTFFGGTGLPAGNDFLIAVLLWKPGTKFTIAATPADPERAQLKRKPSHEKSPPGSQPTDLAEFLHGHVPCPQWRRLEPAV